MARSKKIDIICLAVTLLALIITFIFMNGAALGIEVMADSETETVEGNYFTQKDLTTTVDTSTATTITLSGDTATVSGNGAYYANEVVHIVYAGTYVISGDLKEGQIQVDADGDDKVWLVLEGVNINCEDNAAIYVENADKVFLNLAEGSTNIITSGSSYSSEAENNGIDGVIFSKDDLTINGTGRLSVSGGNAHGIVCNDTLKVTGGTIDVTSKDDAIHANDGAYFAEATLNLTAGDDGITVSNSEGEGDLYIKSGNISVSGAYEGLEAVTITVDGGTLSIESSDDGLNASGSGSAALTINGGVIDVINSGGRDADGLDSNGDIIINGGTVFVTVPGDNSSCALDCGTESGGKLLINGGTVLACGSSGMIENPDSSSKQYSFMYTFTQTAEAGSTLTITKSDGSEVITKTIKNAYSSVCFSIPDMAVNDTYTLTCGDQEYQITLTDTVTSNATGGGMGGKQMGGNGGGGRNNNNNMPSTEGSNFQMPSDGNFQMPNMGGDNSNQSQGQNSGNSSSKSSSTKSNTSTTDKEVDVPLTLLYTGVSILVLAAGLVVAIKFRKRF